METSQKGPAIAPVRSHRTILSTIARRVMGERGFLTDFSSQALHELQGIRGPASPASETVKDMSGMPWCSIDNDDSLDLDQLTVAQRLSDGGTKILVAIADVDALVSRGSALDEHARHNTTTIYTAAETFPMLPEKLSTDFSSLKEGGDRIAVVVEMFFGADGKLAGSGIYRALVNNHAKLSYDGVAAWLDGKGPVPHALDLVPGLAENLRLQDRVARQLKDLRHMHGALDLESIEAHPVFDGEELMDLRPDTENRAKALIEDFMIAANGVCARYLSSKRRTLLRRVVRVPKRWDRIVELAGERGATLPEEADPKALEQFLLESREADPLRFPDLSLSVIKLLGPGEYVAQVPGTESDGHFGLAVKEYAHSTAPNRRFPDLITQRLLKACLDGLPPPYSDEDLAWLAARCTEAGEAARKVERQVTKSAAAILLESRVGDRFDAIVTGASEKGTWVRLVHPPVEGRLETGFEGVDVGQTVHVRLLRADVQMGYIDFERIP